MRRSVHEIERLAHLAAEAFIAASRATCPVERQQHRHSAVAANDALRKARKVEQAVSSRE